MDKLAEQFAQIANHFAPQVIDAAKTAVQINIYSELMTGVIWIILAAGTGAIAWKLRQQAIKTDSSIDHEFLTIMSVCTAGFALLLLVPLVWVLIDPWTWTGIYHPEYVIAKRALGL